MTTSEAFYAMLAAAVSSTAAAGKVYPAAGAPKSGLPRVVYQRIGGTRQEMVSGGSGNHGRARYQVTAYAETQAVAESIMAAVMTGTRTMPQSAPIRACDVELGPYDVPSDMPGRETMVAGVAIDIGITYLEH